MVCKKCDGMAVMWAFSSSSCKNCGEFVLTPHIPSYEYCKECADELNICQQCGEPVSRREEDNQ